MKTNLMAGTLSVAMGWAAAVQAGGAANIEAGAEIAERLCARCHAVGIAGDGAHDAAPPFRTFAQKWPLENLEEALAEGIVVGHREMPAFELSPVEIDNLIGYLGTLQ